MTPLEAKQLRILIAQDVLAQLEAQEIVALPATFLSFKMKEVEESHKVNREELKKNTCQVCAKGSIFVAWVKRFNEFEASFWDVGKFYDIEKCGYRYPKSLLDAFPTEMLDNMESAFECRSDSWHQNAVISRSYIGMFSGPANERLKLIMQHIIANDGEFPLKGKDE